MSGKRAIHVVAFDVPFPPDYGGVTDVYYRCRALKNAGYHVILHCFEYGRGRSHDPSEIADEVLYYSRRKRITDLLSGLPFIVATRNNPALLERLLKDDYPIIFEGQHTTFLLNHPALAERKKLVRLHNIEWQYYDELSKRSDSFPKKVFFRMESRKLHKHEATLKSATVLGCISHSDLDYYKEKFGNAAYIPVGFEQHPVIEEPLNRKPYILFHGNLSVAENIEAVGWLLQAFEQYKGELQLVIAGKNPTAELMSACENRPNVSLTANPDQKNMQQLIQSADAHAVIGFQQSGIKLKLLNALMSGKPCIATKQMLIGTELEDLCTVVSTPEAFIEAITTLKPATESSQKQQERVRELFSEEKMLEIVRELFASVLPLNPPPKGEMDSSS